MPLRMHRDGASRRPVFVIGAWAFKFARGRRGRRCNRYEANVYRRACARRRAFLCPVLWCAPFGVVLVARAAVPLTQAEFDDLLNADGLPDWDYHGLGDEPDPSEGKPSDWGRLDGVIVALDYAALALFDEDAQDDGAAGGVLL